MSDPFIGEVRMVGFNYAPYGWAFCQGQEISIQQNQALFSLLGVTYGGNGTTTFKLPDLRGRSPVGIGAGSPFTAVNIGDVGGQESMTLTSAQMPAHTHAVSGTCNMNVGGTPVSPALAPTSGSSVLGGSLSGSAQAAAIWSSELKDPVQLGNAITPNLALSVAGSSQPVAIRNPFLGINFVISMTGVWPSRN